MKRILLVCHGHPFETIGGVGQVIEQLVAHLPRWDGKYILWFPRVIRGRNMSPSLLFKRPGVSFTH